jgi:hypothetical protein
MKEIFKENVRTIKRTGRRRNTTSKWDVKEYQTKKIHELVENDDPRCSYSYSLPSHPLTTRMP